MGVGLARSARSREDKAQFLRTAKGAVDEGHREGRRRWEERQIEDPDMEPAGVPGKVSASGEFPQVESSRKVPGNDDV